MNKEFLSSPSFDKKSIMENVLAPNGFDGVRAQRDIASLLHEERARTVARTYVSVTGLGSLFCLYNITRLNQLSPSGRPAAIGGFLFFSLMTYSYAKRAQYI